MQTPSRDSENGIDKTQIQFLSYAWDATTGGDDDVVLKKNLLTNSEQEAMTTSNNGLDWFSGVSISISGGNCANNNNASLIQVMIDGSYDEAVRAFDTISQLTWTANLQLRRSFGIIDPSISSGAGKIFVLFDSCLLCAFSILVPALLLIML